MAEKGKGVRHRKAEREREREREKRIIITHSTPVTKLFEARKLQNEYVISEPIRTRDGV